MNTTLTAEAPPPPKSIQDLLQLSFRNLVIRPVLNTSNTIASDLKRMAWLDTYMRAFKKIVTPLSIFSTVFNGVRLEGTDQVSVPFFPLVTDTSTDFDPSVGYTQGNTTSSSVLVNCTKRKYQGLAFTSSEKRRQPNLDPEILMELKGQKLALDVVNDILSSVTIANFGAAVKANILTVNDVADVKVVCDQAQWPETDRALVVPPSIDSRLLQDQSFSAAMAFALSAIKDGRLPKVHGFDYSVNPNIPNNGENLLAFAAHKSAIAVAFAPIEPTEEVQTLTAYDLISDKDTGITLEYRRWGDPDKDTTKEIVECNYGFNVVNTASIKRIGAT
jgi:hypothetical protein